MTAALKNLLIKLRLTNELGAGRKSHKIVLPKAEFTESIMFNTVYT